MDQYFSPGQIAELKEREEAFAKKIQDAFVKNVLLDKNFLKEFRKALADSAGESYVTWKDLEKFCKPPRDCRTSTPAAAPQFDINSVIANYWRFWGSVMLGCGFPGGGFANKALPE